MERRIISIFREGNEYIHVKTKPGTECSVCTYGSRGGKTHATIEYIAEDGAKICMGISPLESFIIKQEEAGEW